MSNYADGASGEYSLVRSDGKLNLNRFKASFDYSLDLIKLREIYQKVYRNNKFALKISGKEYCSRIVNVTFEYGVKEYNRVHKNTFVKLGYRFSDLSINDCVCVQDGKLIGIITGEPVVKPIDPIILGKYFYYKDGKYESKTNIETVVSVSNVRKKLYMDGFVCNGIKFVRWKRSSGSARVGRCLFIDENLYARIHKWETCGIGVEPGDSVDLAAFESYISLTSSSIIGTLDIQPNNILVIDDFDSVFDDDVVSVTESNGILLSKVDRCSVSNSIFDGQSLIDKSALCQYSDKGMVLLRNRFFKSCCFNANIQQWFSDNDITKIEQLDGYTTAATVSEIKLITTPKSIKYIMFGSIEEWLNNLEPTFGVVKYEKPPHFFNGTMVQTHYQLINSIQMTRSEVEKLLQPTFHFMSLIKEEPAVLMDWIKFKIEDDVDITPIKSKTDVIYKMMSITPEFCRTKLYYDFRADFLKSFTKNLKCGRVLVNGNYSTLCGNPIEMLKSSAGMFDGTSEFSPNTISSTRFSYGKKILGSRSPHITFSNVLITENIYYDNIAKYMNATDEIVYINSINENILQKLAGSDFDSDTVLLTDNEILIQAALRNDARFKVAVCNISGIKRKRRYTPEDMADLDICTSKNLIGDIINVSQELNTTVWDMLYSGATLSEVYDIYLDICKLSIMSNVEIDKAKREFTVDNGKELKIIRDKYKISLDGKGVKPYFFAHIAKRKGYYNPDRKLYVRRETSMDYLQHSINRFRSTRGSSYSKRDFIRFSEVVNQEEFNYDNVYDKQVVDVISGVSNMSAQISAIYQNDFLNEAEKNATAHAIRQEYIEYVGTLKFSRSTMIALLKAIEKDENAKYWRLIFYTLFGYPNSSFYDLIISSKQKIPTIQEKVDGNIEIFGKFFAKNG